MRPDVAKRVQAEALNTLTARQRRSSNLYLDPWVVEPGATLGPAFQNVRIDRPTVLVFADDVPLANFGHRCRYFLHDAETGEPRDRIVTQFPPYPFYGLNVLRAFHTPIKPVKGGRGAAGARGPALLAKAQARMMKTQAKAKSAPQGKSVLLNAASMTSATFGSAPNPASTSSASRSSASLNSASAGSAPKGRRFAILFSGATDQNHLNGLELSYRMLVDVQGFDPAHVFVLIHDGTKGANGNGPFVLNNQLRSWPGDPNDSTWHLELTGPGTKAAFQDVCRRLVSQEFNLQPEDLLYIQTEGHGGREAAALDKDVYLVTFPMSSADPEQYFAFEMGADLAPLNCNSLIVMMNQCYSGGFVQSVLNANTTGAKYVACASYADLPSYATNDFLWNDFSLDWMQAQMGAAILTKSPIKSDTNKNGIIQSSEAFNYAKAHVQSHVDAGEDTPNYGAKPVLAGKKLTISA